MFAHECPTCGEACYCTAPDADECEHDCAMDWQIEREFNERAGGAAPGAAREGVKRIPA